MNCDYVQEQLSAFLDREENREQLDDMLAHLYGCGECQAFFNSAVRIRSVAGEDRAPYPVGLDESIRRKIIAKRKMNPLNRRLRLPVYAVSAGAVVLLVLSFAFGYMMQYEVHQRELNALLQAPPARVVYSMPTQVVYPAAMREVRGDIR